MFAVLSIVLLGFILASTDWSDPQTSWALLSSTSDDEGHVTTAWGLGYRGYQGCALVAIEEIALLAGVWLSTRSTPLHRRLGLVVLLGWATLWLVDGFGGLVGMLLAGDFIGVLFISCMSVLPFLFTAGRTALCWRSTPKTTK